MRIRFVAAATFNALLLVSLNSYAAGGGGGGIGGGGPPSVNPSPPSASPPATGGRYPIGAPPSANSQDINNAYEFRNRMSSDPACQDLARQSDQIYMDAKLDDSQKKQKLEQIRQRAKSAGCT